MKCPFCENPDTKVIDSRQTDDGHAIRRRRECEKCNKRFTTYEKIEEMILMVIKKDGSREAFDRTKIDPDIGGCINGFSGAEIRGQIFPIFHNGKRR